MGRRKKQKHSKLLAPLQPDRHEQYQSKKRQLKVPNDDHSYGALVRRTILFQFRLAADGLRDLLLSPISVIAALLGLLNPDNPSWAFDRLMHFGRQTDRWINLFEQEDHNAMEERAKTLDDVVDHMEREVKSRINPDIPPEDVTWSESFSNLVGSKHSNP